MVATDAQPLSTGTRINQTAAGLTVDHHAAVAVRVIVDEHRVVNPDATAHRREAGVLLHQLEGENRRSVRRGDVVVPTGLVQTVAVEDRHGVVLVGLGDVLRAVLHDEAEDVCEEVSDDVAL